MVSNNEYQLFIDQVNKLTDRRQNVSSVYLSVNTAIMAVIAFLVKDAPLTGWKQQTSLLILLLSGIIACDLWRRLIRQYKILLDWWYTQLRDIESTLPECNRIFCREYQSLYLNEHHKPSIGITPYENRLSWLFTMLYVIFIIGILSTIIW